MADSADSPTTMAQRVGRSAGWAIGGFPVLGAVVSNWVILSNWGLFSPPEHNRAFLELAVSAYIGYLAYLVAWGLGAWVRWLRLGSSDEWNRLIRHQDVWTAVLLAILLIVVFSWGLPLYP